MNYRYTVECGGCVIEFCNDFDEAVSLLLAHANMNDDGRYDEGLYVYDNETNRQVY